MTRDLKVLLRALVSSQTSESDKEELVAEQLSLDVAGFKQIASLVKQFAHTNVPYTLPQQVAACGILAKRLNFDSRNALLTVLMGHSYAVLRESIYAQLASQGEGGLGFLKQVYQELKKKGRSNEIESLLQHIGRATAKEEAAQFLINDVASDPYDVVSFPQSSALSELAPSVSSVIVNALAKAIPSSSKGNCLRDVLVENPRVHMRFLAQSILRKPQVEEEAEVEPAQSLFSFAMALFRGAKPAQSEAPMGPEDYTRENTILVLGRVKTRRMHAVKLLASQLIDEDDEVREMVASSLQAQLNLDATRSMLVPRRKPARRMIRYAEKSVLPLLGHALHQAKETDAVKNQVSLLGNISALGFTTNGVTLLRQYLNSPNDSVKCHVLYGISFLLSQLNEILLPQEIDEPAEEDSFSLTDKVEIDRSEASKARAMLKLQALLECYPRVVDLLGEAKEDTQVSAVHLLGNLVPHCGEACRELVTVAKQSSCRPRVVSAVIFGMVLRSETDQALWLDFMSYCIGHKEPCVRKDALCVLMRTPQVAEKLRTRIDEVSQADIDPSVQIMAEQLLEAISSVV